eukprot:CAMPEP_0181417138 /NCGR_PEP_ID=MMETSP1110-20121109/10886_1 /TAXON_ID=174948 /ORGANISM="Symbiodinium sp., Strain CCMP421" /LENGTH=451 /DNA_ID=CAMNT_0023540079 /DNA_START=1 /DNA_END=1355 /DNA_ORIENTATION=-
MRKGGSVGTAARKLVSTKRVHGSVIEWHGNFGWIQASQALDHPEAQRNQGRIFLSGEDVQEDLPGVGAAVTFFLYQDPNGLGAMNVRPDTTVAPKGQYRPQGRPTGKAAPAPAHHVPVGPYRGGYAPVVRGGPVMDRDEVLSKVHNVLNKQVWKATKKIAEQEKTWDHTELCKRVVRYIYKGASVSPELFTLPWHQAAQQFVETAMHGFSNACADKPWFFDLDLASAFGHAFWEILQGSGQRAAWNEVEAVLNGKYEELMDACLLDKAMWEATETCALDQESLRNKVYKALKSGHQAAYDAAMSSPMDDVGRVELFLRTWIETMVGKAWQAVEQGNLLNEDSLVMLFQELLAPFGEEHPFSCVPAVLTQSIGRPPRDWEFLPEAVRQFFQNWNSGGNAGGNAGGYREDPGPGAGGGAEAEAEPEAEAEEEDPIAQALMEQVAAAEAAEDSE